MSERRPPYDRRPTKPLPREKLAPIAHHPIKPTSTTRPALDDAEALERDVEESIATLVKCPLCCGTGMTLPEVASTFDEILRRTKDQE